MSAPSGSSAMAPSAGPRAWLGRALAVAVLCGYAAVAGWAVWHGRFVADEGFYSLAAAQVYEGKLADRRH